MGEMPGATVGRADDRLREDLARWEGSAEAKEVERLLGRRGAALDELLAEAGALRDTGLRRAGRDGIVTYSRKVFIPLTTLCRDRCHYCTFVHTPAQLIARGQSMYLSPDEVFLVATRGADAGCKEALFTLGDRPEDRWPEAREWLDEQGYESTLHYVRAMADLVRAETGLLPHLNPGVMVADELAMLRPSAPSMGMMLETTSRRIFEEPGQAHYGSPDKDPLVRLGVVHDAGRARVPFTTGLLIGIGETIADRALSLLALREAHERHGHVQEVIVQNFRAKPRTAMRGVPDAGLEEYAAAIATARIVFGPDMRIQVPPNLSDPEEFALLLRAGADDWGGVSPVTADHVNPERPWPHLDALAARTSELGFALRERLTVHPEYARDPDEWLDPAIRSSVAALMDDAGLARTDREPAPRASRAAARLIDRAAADPASVEPAEWVSLLEATGDLLEDLAHTADELRRLTVGDAVSIVVNRNVASSAFRAATDGTGQTYDLDDLAGIVADARDLGATEVCVQGALDPAEDPRAYLDLARVVKAAAPGIHLHAYRPADVHDLASRSGIALSEALRLLRESGVDTVPGTGVKVLSERVRAIVAPEDVPVELWVETVTEAHRAGLRSSSVLVYGHAETPEERVRHLLRLREIQSATDGFTELVPMAHPDGVPLVDGRSPMDEHRAMFAVARLALSGSIAHLQVPWTRLAPAEVVAGLRSGGDDLGGTLMDGRVLPRVGVEHGRELPLQEADRLVRPLWRPLRQRTTTYGEPAEAHR